MRYDYMFGSDGDFIVLSSLDGNGEWVYHQYWMIPGTWMED